MPFVLPKTCTQSLRGPAPRSATFPPRGPPPAVPLAPPQRQDDTIPRTRDPSVSFSERVEICWFWLNFPSFHWWPQFSFIFNGNRILTLREIVEQISLTRSGVFSEIFSLPTFPGLSKAPLPRSKHPSSLHHFFFFLLLLLQGWGLEFLPRRSHGATPPRSAFPTTKAVEKVSAVVLGKGSRTGHKRGTSCRRALEGDQIAPLGA